MTEVGRQPWTVYGLLRTADLVSPSLTGVDVLLSLIGYSLVYLLMFPAGIAMMRRIVRARAGRRRTTEPDGSRAAGRRRARVRRCPRRIGEPGMTAPAFDFVPIWTLILGVGVFLYVLLDGFDLGVGILYGFAPGPRLAQPGDELDRADLGRQRDLAGARRRRRCSRRFRSPSPSSCRRSISRSSSCCWRWSFAASRSNSATATPSTVRFWDHGFCYRLGGRRSSRKASCSAHSSRAFRSTGVISPAARSTASRRSLS